MGSKYFEIHTTSLSRFIDVADGMEYESEFDTTTDFCSTLDEVKTFLANKYTDVTKLSKKYIYRDDKKGKAKTVGIVYRWLEHDRENSDYIWEDWVEVQEIKATRISPESWGEVNDVEVSL